MVARCNFGLGLPHILHGVWCRDLVVVVDEVSDATSP
jgi:hypothetical protein